MADIPKGGSFLVSQIDSSNIFTPEDFTDEQKMVYDTAYGFVKDKILPVMDRLEEKEPGLSEQLLLECGELGMLGLEVPEEYGGFYMDKICTAICCEAMGLAGGFCMTYDGQTGIGQLPITYFGNHEQKLKYLPGIVSGELPSAYALTEPGAGSDALSAKAWARLSDDGKYYILNGTKQFITNSQWAKLNIVFAKIDREKFTGFIVETDSEGLSYGPEEHKMGIKSSSTRTLILEDVKVPVENVLYEIGKGHVIAFNVLNMGRFKLAANAVGNCKQAIELSAQFAVDRKQFGQSISEFGLIKEKLGEMATLTYVIESAAYRTAGMLEDIMHTEDLTGEDAGQKTAKLVEEYAIECSINKVFATEVQAFVMDEGVQIHGGYGVTSEYPIERLYRDCRVYRIFEGTNEINRTVMTNTLLRRGFAGTFPLRDAIAKTRDLVATGAPVRNGEADLVQAAKDITLYTIGAVTDKLGENIAKHQEVVGKVADMLSAAFMMESAWLRAEKAVARDGQDAAKLKVDMATVYVNSAISKVMNWAKESLAYIAEGDELNGLLADLQKLAQYTPKNTIALRQGIADAVSSNIKYVC
jgi:alkylation response protein AidB-like acyl-CoA dehydrogenase